MQENEFLAKLSMVGGTLIASLGWIASETIVAFVGVVVLVATFFVNLTFKRRDDRRNNERWEIERKILLSKVEDAE